MKDAWDPNQYDRFQKERSQPFFDLIQMVEPRDGIRIIDLGCGTGELTRQMHDRLRASSTLGIDASDSMLAQTAKHADGGLLFAKGDIAALTFEGAFDLIFSNAAIQWVADHPKLLARLRGALNEGGQLAIQVPANDDHATHESARIVSRHEPFRSALNAWERPPAVLKPEDYAQILFSLKFREQSVRLNVYPHVLSDREAVIEWVRGTLLTDYQRRLPAELWPKFLEAYRQQLFTMLPDDRPFFYPFKRILFWAKR